MKFEKIRERAAFLTVPLDRQIYADAVLVSSSPAVNLFLVGEALGYVGKDMQAMLKVIDAAQRLVDSGDSATRQIAAISALVGALEDLEDYAEKAR